MSDPSEPDDPASGTSKKRSREPRAKAPTQRSPALSKRLAEFENTLDSLREDAERSRTNLNNTLAALSNEVKLRVSRGDVDKVVTEKLDNAKRTVKLYCWALGVAFSLAFGIAGYLMWGTWDNPADRANIIGKVLLFEDNAKNADLLRKAIEGIGKVSDSSGDSIAKSITDAKIVPKVAVAAVTRSLEMLGAAAVQDSPAVAAAIVGTTDKLTPEVKQAAMEAWGRALKASGGVQAVQQSIYEGLLASEVFRDLVAVSQVGEVIVGDGIKRTEGLILFATVPGTRTLATCLGSYPTLPKPQKVTIAVNGEIKAADSKVLNFSGSADRSLPRADFILQARKGGLVHRLTFAPEESDAPVRVSCALLALGPLRCLYDNVTGAAECKNQ